MRVRLTATIAIVALCFGPLDASAAVGRPPDRVQIEDAANDANGLNNQSLETLVPGFPNPEAPQTANLNDQADLLKVWFTNTSRTITAHLQTTAEPGPSSGLRFQVAAGREEGSTSTGCVFFDVVLPDGTMRTETEAWVFDFCDSNQTYTATAEVSSFADGTGHITITADRRTSASFGKGMVIDRPVANSRAFFLWVGPVNYAPHLLDLTKEGSPYRIRG